MRAVKAPYKKASQHTYLPTYLASDLILTEIILSMHKLVNVLKLAVI